MPPTRRSSRRRFLKTAALAGAGAGALGHRTAAQQAAPQGFSTRTVDVVVVGAGFAGMVAAYRLAQAGRSEFISQDQEWARGDYASTPGPGVLTASGFGPAIRAPFGRIHWAGVDTATIWYQSIEGAAQSGERAAREVLAAGL